MPGVLAGTHALRQHSSAAGAPSAAAAGAWLHNPQYLIYVREPTSCVVVLSQPDNRIATASAHSQPHAQGGSTAGAQEGQGVSVTEGVSVTREQPPGSDTPTPHAAPPPPPSLDSGTTPRACWSGYPIAIGFAVAAAAVVQKRGKHMKFPHDFVAVTKLVKDRQVVYPFTLHLDARDSPYVVVPFTQFAGQQTEFVLSVWHKQPIFMRGGEMLRRREPPSAEGEGEGGKDEGEAEEIEVAEAEADDEQAERHDSRPHPQSQGPPAAAGFDVQANPVRGGLEPSGTATERGGAGEGKGQGGREVSETASAQGIVSGEQVLSALITLCRELGPLDDEQKRALRTALDME